VRDLYCEVTTNIQERTKKGALGIQPFLWPFRSQNGRERTGWGGKETTERRFLTLGGLGDPEQIRLLPLGRGEGGPGKSSSAPFQKRGRGKSEKAKKGKKKEGEVPETTTLRRAREKGVKGRRLIPGNQRETGQRTVKPLLWSLIVSKVKKRSGISPVRTPDRRNESRGFFLPICPGETQKKGLLQPFCLSPSPWVCQGKKNPERNRKGETGSFGST